MSHRIPPYCFLSKNQSGRVALFNRCGPKPTVCTTLPIAPCCTSSAALVTQATSKRSEKSIDQILPVRSTHSLICCNCSEVVQPGLSTMTSLPCSIASIANAALCEGIAAISIRSILSSSSSACRSSTLGAPGKRFSNPSSVPGFPSVHQPTNSAPTACILAL